MIVSFLIFVGVFPLLKDLFQLVEIFLLSIILITVHRHAHILLGAIEFRLALLFLRETYIERASCDGRTVSHVSYVCISDTLLGWWPKKLCLPILEINRLRYSALNVLDPPIVYILVRVIQLIRNAHKALPHFACRVCYAHIHSSLGINDFLVLVAEPNICISPSLLKLCQMKDMRVDGCLQLLGAVCHDVTSSAHLRSLFIFMIIPSFRINNQIFRYSTSFT